MQRGKKAGYISLRGMHFRTVRTEGRGGKVKGRNMGGFLLKKLTYQILISNFGRRSGIERLTGKLLLDQTLERPTAEAIHCGS